MMHRTVAAVQRMALLSPSGSASMVFTARSPNSATKWVQRSMVSSTTPLSKKKDKSPPARVLPPMDQIPLVGGEGNNRLVILGTGWGSFNLAQQLYQRYDYQGEVRIVSPANHFLFTPLLPSTAVGTLEFRCIQEPIRKVLTSGSSGNGKFVQAKAQYIDPVEQTILCETTTERNITTSTATDGSSRSADWFKIKYDQLVISVGVKTNTFGIPSIQEGNGIYFLKHLYHARSIRNNIIDCFEKAEIPGTSDAERKRLLSFVIVGGGPTSCEFAAELYDFVTADAHRLYPDMIQHVKVTVVEAGPALLGPFDQKLQEYTKGLFEKRDVDVRLATSVIGTEDYSGSEEEGGEDFRFDARRAILSDGTKLPFGTLVWSAGLVPVNLIQNIDTLPKSKTGRLLVDPYLRVQGHEGKIWAMGDAALCESKPLPQLAQVARQQGLYLADIFRKGKSNEAEPSYKPFEFFSLGSMASLGEFKGIYDGSAVGQPGKEVKVGKMTGWMALFMWRFAYWGRQTSLENKLSIPFHWFKSLVFGRDVSRF